LKQSPSPPAPGPKHQDRGVRPTLLTKWPKRGNEGS